MNTYVGYTPRQLPRLLAHWDDAGLLAHTGPVPTPSPTEAPTLPPEMPPPILPPIDPPPLENPMPVYDPPVNTPPIYRAMPNRLS